MLSGKLLNQVEDDIVKRFKEREDALVALLTVGGVPYGNEALAGRELYDQLVEMRASGDRAYYDDPKAALMMAKLSELYGAPPAVTPPFQSPMQGVM